MEGRESCDSPKYDSDEDSTTDWMYRGWNAEEYWQCQTPSCPSTWLLRKNDKCPVCGINKRGSILNDTHLQRWVQITKKGNLITKDGAMQGRLVVGSESYHVSKKSTKAYSNEVTEGTLISVNAMSISLRVASGDELVLDAPKRYTPHFTPDEIGADPAELAQAAARPARRATGKRPRVQAAASSSDVGSSSSDPLAIPPIQVVPSMALADATPDDMPETPSVVPSAPPSPGAVGAWRTTTMTVGASLN